jgi:hypothetical protein
MSTSTLANILTHDSSKPHSLATFISEILSSQLELQDWNGIACSTNQPSP